MPITLPADSVGLVTPQTIQFNEPLLLACGKTLDNYQLVYETPGAVTEVPLEFEFTDLPLP